MNTSRTSLSQQTPTAFGAPNPPPSDSAPNFAPVSAPAASTRSDRLSTVALVIFISVYAFFFPLHLGHSLIPGDADPATGLVLYTALFAVGYAVFRYPLAQVTHQVAARKRRVVLTLIVGGLAILVIELVGGLMPPILLNLAGLSGAALQNDASVAEVAQMLPPIIIVVVLGIVGPIVEEMFFRQPLIGLIKHFVPAWVAAVVSSVLFGALHTHSFVLSEVLSVVPHVFFGLSCGLLYVKTDRNLLYPASIHYLNNLSAPLSFLPH